MIAFILDLISGNWQWIGGALLAVAAALGLRQSGKTAERNKARAKAAEKRTETLDEVIRRKDDAGNLSDDDLADRLSRRK